MSAHHVEEIEGQGQECIDAGLVLEYKNKQYPSNCSACFLVAKPCCTAPRLVVDYGKVNKRTQSHSSSLPTMDHNLERIPSCRYKTEMNKRSGLRQVDDTAGAREPLAFVSPQARVLKWLVMRFGVANVTAVL